MCAPRRALITGSSSVLTCRGQTGTAALRGACGRLGSRRLAASAPAAPMACLLDSVLDPCSARWPEADALGAPDACGLEAWCGGRQRCTMEEMIPSRHGRRRFRGEGTGQRRAASLSGRHRPTLDPPRADLVELIATLGECRDNACGPILALHTPSIRMAFFPDD